MAMPHKFVRLSSEWYSGQSDLLYAVSSSGGLKRGTIRPMNEDTGKPCNNLEWKLQLYLGLRSDIRAPMRQLEKQPDSKDSEKYIPRFKQFLEWTDRQITRLESKLEKRSGMESDSEG